MPTIKPRHYIWEAYKALAKAERLTAQQALDRLQTAFPHEPVVAIIKAEGQLDRSLGDVLAAPLPQIAQQDANAGTDAPRLLTSEEKDDIWNGLDARWAEQDGRKPASGQTGGQPAATFNDVLRDRSSRHRAQRQTGRKDALAQRMFGQGAGNQQDQQQDQQPSGDFIRDAFNAKRG